ncbi:hypothetical protein PC129_g16099 [Phytophthora cactorum]|uniref:Uncharacterized protein n=2 Tax=Phytophthora cactorum TaxID=29920 RepID=A0A8T1HLR8_9STRA|nr:hypothetical protein PC129_g16099 [Phytophthora cactorum]
MENQEHIFSQVVVQASIKKRLSGKKVGFAIDTWTEDGTHFVAIIGITELEKILLRFAALENDAVISSDAIIDLLDDVLDMKTQVSMIGCASHRFNLAMQALMGEHSDLLDKRNATRWSSTFAMVDRYFRFYDKVDRLDDGLADIIHTPRENVPLKTLHEDLKNLECQQVTSDVGGVLARRMRTFRPHGEALPVHEYSW